MPPTIESELQLCHRMDSISCAGAGAPAELLPGLTQVCVSERCSASCPMALEHFRNISQLSMREAMPPSRHMLPSSMLKATALPAPTGQDAALGLCSVARDRQRSLCRRPERVRTTLASPVRSLTCVPWSPGTCQELVRSHPACCRHFAGPCLRQGTLTETCCMHTAGPAAGDLLR